MGTKLPLEVEKKGSSNSVKSYSGAVSSPLARLDLKTPVDVQVDYELASILVVAIRPLRSHIWTDGQTLTMT